MRHPDYQGAEQGAAVDLAALRWFRGIPSNQPPGN